MAVETRLIGEIRTVDENGILIRVQVYEDFAITGDEEGSGEEIPGSLRYVTDDGMTCEPLPGGALRIVMDGRVLSRIV